MTTILQLQDRIECEDLPCLFKIDSFRRLNSMVIIPCDSSDDAKFNISAGGCLIYQRDIGSIRGGVYKNIAFNEYPTSPVDLSFPTDKKEAYYEITLTDSDGIKINVSLVNCQYQLIQSTST